MKWYFQVVVLLAKITILLEKTSRRGVKKYVNDCGRAEKEGCEGIPRAPIQAITLFFTFPLLDDAMTVGVKQFLKVVDLLLNLLALVGIRHPHALGRHLHDLCGTQDVGTTLDGVGG